VIRAGRTVALALALAAAVMLAGCSAIRLGYNQSDTIALYYADEYFDLTRAQKDVLQENLYRLQAWHRRTQLPDYVRFLTETKTRLERGPTTADVYWFVDGITERYRVLVRAGFDDATASLSTLTQEQINHLQRQLDKDNAKFVRETRLEEGPEARKRAQFKRTLDRTEEWVGNLSREQEARLREMVFSMPLVNQLRNDDRRRRQRELVEILGLRQDRAQFAPKFRAWLLDWEAGRGAEYEKVLAVVYKERAQIFVTTWNQFTPAQRAHALRRLQGYIDDLNALAAQAPGTTAVPANASTKEPT
jgi:hypothetical protein